MANITSGAIQYGVPTKLLAGDVILALPKSAVEKILLIITLESRYREK